MSDRQFELMMALRELQPRCKHPGCYEYPHTVPDTSKPNIRHEEPTKIYINEDGERIVVSGLTATIAPPLKKHPSGLCYYHLKRKENYFTAKYPLKGNVSEMGKGGLSECPSSINTSYGYAGKPKRPGRPVGS